MRCAVIFSLLVASVQGSFIGNLIHPHHGSSSTKPDLKLCHAGADLFKVNAASGLKVVPYPIKKGDEFTVTLTGTMTQTVRAVKMSLNVHYGMIPMGSYDVDLCGQIHCPIPEGPFNMVKTVKLPGAAPSGSYKIAMKGHNEYGQEVICAELGVQIN